MGGGGGPLCLCLLLFVLCKDVSGIKIRNKLLGKCLQVSEEYLGGRVSLGECDPDSALQEWDWLPESKALRSHHRGECLTAPREEYEGVHLRPCIFGSGEAVEDTRSREASGQAWDCSKKSHLTLIGMGLHLSATQESSLVFLSREHKQQGSRWRTLDNQSLCKGSDGEHKQPHHHLEESVAPEAFTSFVSDLRGQAETSETKMTDVPEPHSVTNVTDPVTRSPADPRIYSEMAWKISMLVLSSLALVMGAVILILSVCSNRRKKVVCVLKSYSPRSEMVVASSPARSERAPLAEHAAHLSQSTPGSVRGEILIQWKDGSVTPLYEA